MSSTEVRQRRQRPQPENEATTIITEKIPNSIIPKEKKDLTSRRIFLAIVGIALVVRLYNIQYPGEVVFDEVHFGGFANRYLRGEYYFDVHPPLGKMLMAGIARLGGYTDGGFGFSKIADAFPASVPYVWMRSVQAVLGVSTIALAFMTLIEMGIGPVWAGVGCLLMALDTALTVQVRYILLDAMLMFFIMGSVYTWVKFRTLRYEAFSPRWFLYLSLCGASLGCTLSVKMVGVLTIGTMGIGTAWDLWQLADKRRGLSDIRFAQHFLARAVCLIVLPLVIYFASFYVHLSLLTRSGPGDAFMSPEFQSNLIGNPMNGQSRPVRFGQEIRLRSRIEQIFLHSHDHRIPLNHEDGKVSSNGQQVNGYPVEDANNVWILQPIDADKLGARVQDGDEGKLRHKATGKILLTHDVASALTRTNQELTAIEEEKDTLGETTWRFKVKVAKRNNDRGILSLSTEFQFINTRYGVYLHNQHANLPQWAFQQRELNGDKRGESDASIWLVSEEDALEMAGRKPVKMSFWQKYVELQGKMLKQNAALVDNHPNKSTPDEWPFVQRGLPFWEKPVEGRRVYLLGSLPAWFFGLLGIVVAVIRTAKDAFSQHRGWTANRVDIRKHFQRAGFLFLCYILHYVPFYAMHRSLYLHHYLPAFIFSCMLLSVMLDYLWTYGHKRTAITLSIAMITLTVGWFVIYAGPLVYAASAPKTSPWMLRLKLFRGWDWP